MEVNPVANSLKIVLDEGTFYLKTVDDNTWGAFVEEDFSDTPVYVFSAPEDATKGELEAELECIVMQDDSLNSSDEDDFEDDNDYADSYY